MWVTERPVHCVDYVDAFVFVLTVKVLMQKPQDFTVLEINNKYKNSTKSTDFI